MAIVLLEKVVKNYKSYKIIVPAIKNIDLTISKGEFSVLAGPSGSGKTTLLNIIGAMDKITSGKVVVDNKDISILSRKEAAIFRRDKIGFIFQSFNLIPVLSVYENIEFSLDLLKKYNKKEKKAKVDFILKELGIYELRNRKPSEISGGQKQRVAVGRALIKKPTLILADEPTANLDSKTGEGILDLMKELNENYNITFIFSSHDTKIIERAERVIKLKDGMLEEGE